MQTYAPRRWCSVSSMIVLMAVATASMSAGISPSQLDINLGPIPIDNYLLPNNYCGGSCGGQYYVSSACPATSTIQSCIKTWFTGSGGYISQGVKGARFAFPLGGGNYSTAWDSNGNVQQAWVSKFLQFMQDLKSYGVQRVNPTIAIIDYWSGTPIMPNPPIYSACDGKELMFFKWVPFGEYNNSSQYGYPDCQGNMNGYSMANANPYFWGWAPYLNAVSAIIQSVKTAGLTFSDFDLVNELDVTDFTVAARMIWDNKHGSEECSNGTFACTAVLSDVRYYFTQNGFSYGPADYSTTVYNPTVAAYDCTSVYGDSAMLLHESGLLGAIAGANGKFGPSSPSWTNNLPCGGNTSQMISLPVSYVLTQPTSTDVHAYICVVSTSNHQCVDSIDATSTSKAFFSDVWSMLSNHGLTSNYMVFGETFPNQPNTITPGNFTEAVASQEASGYTQSTLFTNHASSVTFRPWEYPIGTTSQYTQMPAQVNPPF